MPSLTNADNLYVHLNNSGILSATNAGAVYTIRTETDNPGSPIVIINTNTVTATSTAGIAIGMFAYSDGGTSKIEIVNSADATVDGVTQAIGIFAKTHDGNSPVSIINSGDFVVTSTAGTYGTT